MSAHVIKQPMLNAQVVSQVDLEATATLLEAPRFEERRFDNLQAYWPLLIPYVGCVLCPCIVTSSVSLVLEEEEAVLFKTNCCCSSVERRPYAQLVSKEENLVD